MNDWLSPGRKCLEICSRITPIDQDLKLSRIVMGDKEGIAWNNCRIILSKFDELDIHYTYCESPVAYLAGVEK